MACVVVGNHFDAGTPIEAAGFLVAGHALDGNGHVDMAESAHLFGDGDGLPLELAGQRDVHEIRAAHSPAHRQGTGKWPCRGGSVFGRLENLDDFAGPEPVVPVVGLVKFDSHESSGKAKRTNTTRPSIWAHSGLGRRIVRYELQLASSSFPVALGSSSASTATSVCIFLAATLCRCIGVAIMR